MCSRVLERYKRKHVWMIFCWQMECKWHVDRFKRPHYPLFQGTLWERNASVCVLYSELHQTWVQHDLQVERWAIPLVQNWTITFCCCCPTICTNLRGIAPMLFITACLLLATPPQGSVHIAALLVDVHRRRHQIVGWLPSEGTPAVLLSDFGEDLLWLSFCQLMLSAGNNALEWQITDAESLLWVNVNVPQLKPWGSSSVGWEGSVCSCFPTPVHTAMHKSAVLPATPAAAL